MFKQAFTSLADVEDRLRRRFGSAGTIGAAMDPTISLSLDVGSLFGPGNNTFAGRRWSWARQWGGTVAVGNEFGLRFDTPVVIEEVETASDTVAGQGFYWKCTTVPGAGVFGAPANPATWREILPGDVGVQGPQMSESGFSAGAAFTGAFAVQPSGGGTRTTRCDLYLRAGAYLYVQNYGTVISAANPWFVVRGRIADSLR